MIKKIGKKFFEILTKISPKFSTTILYILRTKEIPNLKNPKNFNEKTTMLKLSYANNDLVSKCSDKYAVREYVEKKGLGKILNDLYYVYNKVEDIDFNKLPNQFALKCTHGCAYNIICEDKSKLNEKKAKDKLNKYMKEKYGLATGELHYLNIKPRIICEKYLETKDGKMPIDYKLYCIDGKVVGILVCSEREKELRRNFFDTNWNELMYIKDKYRNKNNIEKPKGLDEMIKYAEILSKDFKFVRVDLYDQDGKILFGELTFTPACCCNKIYNKKGNLELGQKIKGV